MTPDDLAHAYIDWDAADDVGGNAWHIAPTGITQAEVEAIIRDTGLPVLDSGSSGQPLKIGTGADGREIVVVWEVWDESLPLVHPRTAYYRRKP